MNLLKRLSTTSIELDEQQATRLREPAADAIPIEVKPPRTDSALPATVDTFVRGIQELQRSWFGLSNASPVLAFEIRRPTPETTRLQYVAPTHRLARKIRTHLSTLIPDVGFEEGVLGLPVTEGSTVGGGLLTAGRRDRYPFKTDFDEPPLNAVVGSLHRHAMRDVGIVIQILFQPVVGRPLRRWWWRWRAYKRLSYLRKEKEKLWGSRPPTKRERSQANAIERKAGTTRFHVSIRVCVLDGKEFVPSRVKEIAGGFNVFESADTGQYFDAVTLTPLVRDATLHHFARSLVTRSFGRSHRRFQLSVPELAALLAIPDRRQENLNYANP